MEQRFSDKICFREGYRLDAQLLQSLNKIIQEYNSEPTILIEVRCNKTTYSFKSIDEFLELSSTLPERIEELTIDVTFGEKYSSSSDKMCLHFSDDLDLIWPKNYVSFEFQDANGFYSLKEQIVTLLKNYRLSYSFLARFPIIPFLSVGFLVFICLFTWKKEIVFPKVIQIAILVLCICGAVSGNLVAVCKMKGRLFPPYEFCFGVNPQYYKKAENVRSILGIGTILAFVVSFLASCVYGYLFP